MWCSAVGVIVTLTLSILVAPLAAEAQQAAQVPRIGVLMSGPVAPRLHLLEAFRQGLREQGYIEGQNIVLVLHSADGSAERLPPLAAELVRFPVDIILAPGFLAAQAAKHTTSTIPIVIAVGDAVGSGLVASLARPGGNITDISDLTPEVIGKRLELLKEAVPALARVAVLWNPTDPAKPAERRATQDAARELNVTLQWLEVRAFEDFESAFAAIRRERHDALITFEDALTLTHRTQILEFAATARLPAIYPWRDFVQSGGLMTYGPKVGESWRRAAFYVDKILKGAKPGDLPVEQPIKFELAINLKTAKALSLTIPPTLLFQADEVIQ